MGKSKRRSRKRSGTIILLAILAVAAFGVTAVALFRPTPTVTGQAIPRPTITSTIADPVRVSIPEAMSRLDDTGRPFTVVVLGDSTGAEANSWPTLVAEWISQEYDRPVTMHLWREGSDPAGYLPPAQVSDGVNAEVTLYNGSAAGKDAAYTAAQLTSMIPVDMRAVDLVLINHGHNHAANKLVEQIHPLITQISTNASQAAIGFILQNPEEIGKPHAIVQERNTEAIRQYSERFAYESINVRQTFLDYGDFRSLYKDPIHIAGEPGYRLWADTVIETLSSK